MASHFCAGLVQERSCSMHAMDMAVYSSVPYTSAARTHVATIASTSSSRRSSGSIAPMWKPVTPSFTVSTRPPVEDTTGTVPYCIAWSWMRPHGSKREGTIKKSAPAVMKCASGEENFTAPAALGSAASSFSTAFSIFFLPVPSTTTCASGTSSSSLGMAASMMSTPFCSSRRPMYPKSGASGSMGRPTSACSVCFATALPSTTVSSSYSMSRNLSLDGSHSVGSMPFTMPSMPPTSLITSSSSTPLSAPDMTSVA
mmetsp:Transcript_11386/g.39597  ORF Transcript_11386/g.39597 Transcript_11386/m.39597 type:complete len:256 (+) Transcript_11386:193-960(+)